MQTAAPFAIFPHNVTTTSPLPDPPDVKLKKGRSFAKHPVVFVPANVTGQLKLRETHSCANGLFRQRLWGGTFGELHKKKAVLAISAMNKHLEIPKMEKINMMIEVRCRKLAKRKKLRNKA